MRSGDSPPLLSELRKKYLLVGVLCAAAMLTLASGALSAIGTLLGACLFAVALAAAVVLLRCPSCGEHLFLHAISRRPVSRWLNWLVAVRECPSCGYTVDDRPACTGKPSDQTP